MCLRPAFTRSDGVLPPFLDVYLLYCTGHSTLTSILSAFPACESRPDHRHNLSGHKSRKPYALAWPFSLCTHLSDVNAYPTSVTVAISTVLKLLSFLQSPTRSLNLLTLHLSSLPMSTGRLKHLKPTSESKSAAEVSRQIASHSKPMVGLKLRVDSKWKSVHNYSRVPSPPGRLFLCTIKVLLCASQAACTSKHEMSISKKTAREIETRTRTLSVSPGDRHRSCHFLRQYRPHRV